MSFESFLSALGVVVAIVCSVAALARNRKKDHGEEAEKAARMDVILSSIQSGVEEIRLDQKAMRDSFNSLSERVFKVEERCKSNGHRITKIEENIETYHPRT